MENNTSFEIFTKGLEVTDLTMSLCDSIDQIEDKKEKLDAIQYVIDMLNDLKK